MPPILNSNPQLGDQATLPLNDADPIDFVWCPSGQFVMGTPPDATIEGEAIYTDRESPVQVTLTRGFWISIAPITEQQWFAIMGKHSDEGESHNVPTMPAAGLTWWDAKKFCEIATQQCVEKELFRQNETLNLPTEAQWEYACRANTTSLWHFGDNVAQLVDYAWYQVNSRHSIHPVKQKLPNPWGLYDVYGNVDEWCLDDYSLSWFHSKDGQLIDPLNTKPGSRIKIVRGGAYNTKPPKFVRSGAKRSMDTYMYEDSFAVGLRPVINITA